MNIDLINDQFIVKSKNINNDFKGIWLVKSINFENQKIEISNGIQTSIKLFDEIKVEIIQPKKYSRMIQMCANCENKECNYYYKDSAFRTQFKCDKWI